MAVAVRREIGTSVAGYRIGAEGRLANERREAFVGEPLPMAPSRQRYGAIVADPIRQLGDLTDRKGSSHDRDRKTDFYRMGPSLRRFPIVSQDDTRIAIRRRDDAGAWATDILYRDEISNCRALGDMVAVRVIHTDIVF